MDNDSDTFEVIAKHAVWIGRVSEDDPIKSTDKPNAINKISKPQRKRKVKQ
jgi:hypothetical protein